MFFKTCKDILFSVVCWRSSKNEGLTSLERRSGYFVLVAFLITAFYFWKILTYKMTSGFQDDGEFFTRDSGMLFTILDFFDSASIWDFIQKIQLAIEYGLLQDDAPLQFWLNNLYITLFVRDFFPLDKAVILFPKVIIGALGGLYAYLLGRRLYCFRLGVVFALLYCLAPWCAFSVRFSTMYPQLISLMHLIVLYYYSEFILDSKRPLWRLLAPLSLAIYLTTGLDWPFFLGVIFGYLLINVSVKKALYNWYNLLPIAVFLTHLFFALRVAGLWGNWEYGLGRWKSMFLVYPFKKVITHAQAYHYDLGAIIKFFNTAYTFSWYIAAFSALIISATFFFSVIKTIKFSVLHNFKTGSKRIHIGGSEKKSRIFRAESDCHFSILMALWVVILVIPFCKAGPEHMTYAFAMAVPIAFLTSWLLTQENVFAELLNHFKLPYIFMFILFVGYFQLHEADRWVTNHDGSNWAEIGHLNFASAMFTMAIPIAFLTSWLLNKKNVFTEILGYFKLPYIFMFILTVGFFQLGEVYRSSKSITTVESGSEQRILAVSAFIIENRPDLLTAGKVAFLPNYAHGESPNPYTIGYYAMGDYYRLKPSFWNPQKDGTPVAVFNYIENIGKSKHGKDILNYIDWIVMPSEMITVNDPAKNKLDGFYKQIMKSPMINWIARIKNEAGREVYFGEIIKDKRETNKSYNDAKVYDTKQLVDVYQKKYNFRSYLKQSVGVRIKYW